MCRMIVLSAAIAILASSAAIAGIGQSQWIDATLINEVAKDFGFGAVGNSQFVTVSQNQFTVGADFTLAAENESVALGQGASTIGLASAYILQGLQTFGTGQIQLVSTFGPKVQGQGIALVAGQTVIKDSGPGVVVANQGASGSQGQTAGNMHGIMTESSRFTAGQSGGISGMASGYIAGGIVVLTGQGQMAIGSNPGDWE